MTRYEKQKENIANWSPERQAELKARQREKSRLQREKRRADPAALESHLAGCREHDKERYRQRMARLKADPEALKAWRAKTNERERRRLAVRPRKQQERTPERAARWQATQERYRDAHRAELNARMKERRVLEKAAMTPEEHEAERLRSAAYHKEYRAKNAAMLKAKKKAYYATPKGREEARLSAIRLHRRRGMKPRSRLPDDEIRRRAAESKKRWKAKNPDWYKNNYRRRASTQPEFRMVRNLRSRIRNFLRGKDKSASTMTLLGCTLDELKAHLEKQFAPWMNWTNYGMGGWVMDHVVPCALFDMTKPDQQAKCFHYSNLAPLEWISNIRKGDKLLPGIPHPNPSPQV